METKSLTMLIVGFLAGGLLVSTAAVTFEKDDKNAVPLTSMSESMHQSANSLRNKSGDEFDKAFIEEMIMHHEGAVDMAELAAERARHDEIKTLSRAIIAAQEKEIQDMKKWQKDWGYSTTESNNHMDASDRH